MLQTGNSKSQKKSAKSSKAQSQDIVDIIREDHEPLKELIEVMKDSELEFEERLAAFQEFAPLLIAHAKPEEEVLYAFMKKDEELREDAFEGDVEHVLADQLLEEIKRTKDEDLCSARIKVLAELVEHHIEEEEEELLPDFEEGSSPEQRTQLGSAFLKLKVNYLAAGNDNVIPDPKTEQMNRKN